MNTPIESRPLVAGRWIDDAPSSIRVTNPANDQLVAEVPSLRASHARDAIAAAHDAWPAWRARPAHERAAIVSRLASFMRRDADRLARIMTLEQGKPLAEAKGEIAYAASFLDFAAGECVRACGEMVPASTPEKRILVMRQPVGVCAIITPWNFPSAMITRKIGPALAAGCTVVVKPSEETPLSAIAIAQLGVEAGVPAGVLNIVCGEASEIGGALLGDDRVRKLSFTGSTEIGSMLMAQAARNVMRVSLELGGHAPLVVFEDADMERAVAGALANKLRNAGQTCICANRFYVHRSIKDEFASRLARAMESLPVGNGLREGVKVGPLINDDAMEKVELHVADACDKGARVVTGGSRVRLDGLADRFYAPTVLDGLTPDMLAAKEETFGPVAPIAAFDTENEAIALANGTPYGLAAYFYTRDASRLMRVAEALEFGVVGANDAMPSTAQAPFGGVKRSGVGREGGRWVMDEYTEAKYVSWGL
ncbi:MAG: NAD-dependent succinate-semialdehyde dehydrogenase [Phycisphaerales bacterium]|jgi:succinate-semialdehyde dehydrogenase/glutarate-semialdehyde dehydrogenase|nr:NAD-dependent succinate-semialdehyde dehydrogenase [Phycisphaerales bacterium]